MNDWDIKEILILVISIQFGLLGSIGLDLIGFNIPILRQLIGFIYLTFIPGMLILRILKIHNLGDIDTLLYSTGLSLSTLMFTGFLINMVYPIFGIAKPISSISLSITISVFVLSLCAVCYLRDNSYCNPKYIEIKDILSPALLSLLFIPFMAITGTYLENVYNNNIILMLMIAAIAVVVLLIEFSEFIPSKFYPLAIWILSISLIWHYSLITDYSVVHDGEFYTAKTIIENNIWNWNIFGNYNSILSVTILSPVIHFFCNISLTSIHKIIFPIFLSFISLSTYSISNKYLNERLSFLAAFILIINSEYYMMPTITKQLTAMFFVMLVFMLIFRDNVHKLQFSILSIIFSLSIIVSHYGTSYLTMISFIFTVIFLGILRSRPVRNLAKIVYSQSLNQEPIKSDSNITGNNVSFTFILLFVVCTLSWYVYISNSSVLNTILNISSHVVSSFTSFYDPDYSRGAYMLSKDYNGLRLIHKYLKLGIPFFIVVGLVYEFLHFKKSKFNSIYFGFSIYYLAILFASVLVAYFSVMSPGRLYILSLPLLAPLGVIGGLQISRQISSILRLNNNSKVSFLFIYFILLMLLNTHFLYTLTNDHPMSPSLSHEYINKYGDVEDKAKFYSSLIMEYDIFSFKWLDGYGVDEKSLYFTSGYSHIGSVLRNLGYFPMENIKSFNERTTAIPNNQYIVLIYLNVKENIGLTTTTKVIMSDYFDMKNVSPLLNNTQKIYSNGESVVLLS